MSDDPHAHEVTPCSLLAVVLPVIVLSCDAPAAAHHAFAAEFDATKPFKIRGTVVKMEWINPHTWLHLDVKRADGKMERWMIEGGPPNALYRRGFTKNSLPVGQPKSWSKGSVRRTGRSRATAAS